MNEGGGKAHNRSEKENRKRIMMSKRLQDRVMNGRREEERGLRDIMGCDGSGSKRITYPWASQHPTVSQKQTRRYQRSPRRSSAGVLRLQDHVDDDTPEETTS